MCQECRQHPCDPRCPNAPEPKAVCRCDNCGGKIYDGDTMWKFDIGIVCEECVDRFRTYADLEDEF